MPGRREAATIDHSLCRRCQSDPPTITVRTEPLCAACFSKYVLTKVVKRMESFRVRHSEPGAERTLLIPLSFGACSTALLHILSQHLKGQTEKTGRTGFKLRVVHIYRNEAVLKLLDKVRERYTDITFGSCELSDVLSTNGVRELFRLDASDSLLLPDAQAGDSQEAHFAKLLSQLDSPTSRADVEQILLHKLVASHARQHGCEATLWAHSTTRLAERTLAETAKGRGSSLPWIVPDGDALHGIPSYYPMRDLLSKEIAAFTSIIEPPLDDIIAKGTVKPAVSTKNTTIDDLMKQYFESVEQEYPSVVANVVKTTGKLQAMPLDQIEKQCELCDVPLDGQGPERSRLCYGCLRTLAHAGG